MKTILEALFVLYALSLSVPAMAQYGSETYGNVPDVLQSQPASQGQTFVFQNPGFAYTIQGLSGNNPAITMERGKTYTLNFQEVTSGHPIALRLSSGSTSAVQGTSGNNPSSGVAGSGAVVTYTVPLNAPDRIVYQCVFHPSMLGTINIVNANLANVPPVVAIIGGSRTVADTNAAAGESVALTATATDSDGTIASTQWLVAGQVVATGTSATIVLADGATTVTFRATDNSGATTSTTATITVMAPVVNVPPVVAIIGGSRTVADTNAAAGESVALTATATDSDGTIASTQWLVAGQVVATGTSATLALPDGATVVTFRATDNSGATTSTTATITVMAPVVNVPPVVAIIGGSRTVADTNAAAGESVALTATATDSDGTIASTQWLVAGQVVATGTSATLALPDGATTVLFRATDDKGATTSTSAVITVGSVEAKPADYLGTYNGVAVDPRYKLEVNQVGLIIIDRSRLHSCVRIFENSQPAQVAGMNKIDVTFNFLSLDTGAIQIVATRPFSDQSSTDAQPAQCSGRFETTTGIYRDYINLGTQLFDASFRLVNDNTLEFSLVDAQEVLIKD